MFGANVRNFIRDEAGGYTIWSLIWFSIYVAIGGLAVDLTDAYRNQTLLQATADSSALSGVLSLPDVSVAKDVAVAYSSGNMAYSVNGSVLNRDEVLAGDWDLANKTFSVGGANLNAVRVVTRRDNANANPLAANFLRIVSLWGIPFDRFNISVEAIAIRYVPSCLNDGFVALGSVSYQNDNGFFNNICIHGQNDGVALRGKKNFHEPGVRVSMSNLDDLDAPGQAYGTVEDALVEGDLWPKDVDRLDDIIDGLRTLDPNYLPDFMVDVDADEIRTLKLGVQSVTGSSLPATTVQNTVYVINCNGQIELPGTLISKVVVVADCRIHSNSGANLQNAVVATSYDGSNDSIHMAAQSTLGLNDDCDPGGGVEMYTPGDVHLTSNGEWHGLRVVAGGDVHFNSNIEGVWGISVQAGGDIDLQSNNNFGLCAGGNPGNPAYQYRLVL